LKKNIQYKMDATLWKWMKTPEAKKIATSAQEKA